MINYLEKYKSLDPELKARISSPEVLASIEKLEKEYGAQLAIVVMRVMIKDLSLVDLSKYFIFSEHMDAKRAEELAGKMKDEVFSAAGDYLGIKQKDKSSKESVPAKAISSGMFFTPDDEEEVSRLAQRIGSGEVKSKEDSNKKYEEAAERIISAMNIKFSSQELSDRFRNIIKTYVRGIRNRVDTRQAMVRAVHLGGLGMENEEAVDKILSAAEIEKNKVLGNDKNIKTPPKIVVPEDAVKDAPKSAEQRPEDKKPAMPDPGLRDAPYDFSKLVRPEGPKTPAPGQDSPAPAAPVGESGEKQEAETQLPPALDLRHPEKQADLAVPEPDKGQKPSREEKPEAQKPKSLEEVMKSLDEGNGQEKEAPEKDINNLSVKPTEVGKDDSSDHASTGRKEDKKDDAGAAKPASAESSGAAKQDDKVIKMIHARRGAVSDSKVKMEDVKYVPKLTGPVEELREISLVNFRRLGEDPETATQSIKDKIRSLERDGYGKRLAAIKAWRESPINKLYLAMGAESISQERPIDDIIEERKNSNKDYLSRKEFSTIMDLNKSLRF